MGGNRTLLPGVSLERPLLPAEIFPWHGSLVFAGRGGIAHGLLSALLRD